MSAKTAIVIPARMSSTRYPGKPLVDLVGKPMVQWVVEAARKANITDTVIVATPDQEILDACRDFGAEALLTRDDHVSGTDRIAEVATHCDADLFINVQGDEPLIDPATIRECATPLIQIEEEVMSSVYCTCPESEFENPAVVKVVTDLEGHALYFSRFPIPFPRNSRQVEVKRHIGIYGYRREILHAFSAWSPSPLEGTESLEQLRFLEHGVRIRMVRGVDSEIGVDTPAQADEVRALLRERLSSQ